MGQGRTRRAAALGAAFALMMTFGAGGAAVAAGRAGPGVDAATWRAQVARVLTEHGDESGAMALAGAASASAVLTADRVPSAAASTLTVTPTTGLVSGQALTVAGTGWTGAGVVLLECDAAATDVGGCDFSSSEFLEPDGSGAFSGVYPARRILHTDAGDRRDCAVDVCALVAVDPDTAAPVASQVIAFDPTAPLPSPTLTVQPATGLIHGQTVTVSGTGWVPGSDVFAGICATDAPFCGGSGVYVVADASGAFSAPLRVSLRVIDETTQLSDCLTVACEVRAEQYSHADYAASAAVSFDPSQPPPPVPAVTVEPVAGLVHDQTVTVSGTGFDPGSYIDLSECPAAGVVAYCADYLGSTEADGTGAFTLEVTVSRLVSVFSLIDGTSTLRDCAVDACEIRADGYTEDSGPVLDAATAITFDPSVPPPALPEVSAAPLDDLPYRAAVTVTGDGFAPNSSVLGGFCVNGPQIGGCVGFLPGIADGSGHVDLTIQVRRLNGLGGDVPIDCAAPESVCSIRVQGERSYEQWTFPLTFDPDAPIPPPPTATVTPDRDLDYRQNVAVAGTGFTPGPVAVAQCALRTDAVEGGFPVCVGSDELTAAADGTLSGAVSARRIITQGFGDPIDCATSVGRCYLLLGGSPFDFYSDPLESVHVDLGFDPASTPPPPPPVTVEPHTGLHDGQSVHVHGSGFDPNASIGVTACAAGTTSLDACDLNDSRIVSADAAGVVDLDYVVHARIATGSGPVDCTSAPGTCALGVANIADYLQYSLTPLEFSVPDIELHSVTVTEGTGGVTAAPVPVEVSEPAPGPITVTWAADPGSATGADFTAAAGTVVIPAGATEAVIPAEVVADALDESTERFTVRIVSATGAHVTDGDAIVKIRDDDVEPEVSVGDWHATEGDGVAYTLVGLSAPSGRAVTVEWRTHHDSARSDRDFERTRGEIDFAPGQQWAVIAVPLVDDAVGEPTERFRIELRDADEAEVGDGDAWIAVADDD